MYVIICLTVVASQGLGGALRQGLFSKYPTGCSVVPKQTFSQVGGDVGSRIETTGVGNDWQGG